MGKKSLWFYLILFFTIVSLFGCAMRPPVKNLQITTSNLPPRHLVENVPTYRQPYMDCGPTSLRMVLNFYGMNSSQEEVGRARRGRGTIVSDMESYPRGQGFEVYTFYDWRKDETKYLLAQGYPLVVLGVPPPEWYKTGRYSGEGHYVVVVGYDDQKKIFIIHDPSPGRKIEISYEVFKDFHRSHPTHGNYVLCIYPKRK